MAKWENERVEHEKLVKNLTEYGRTPIHQGGANNSRLGRNSSALISRREDGFNTSTSHIDSLKNLKDFKSQKRLKKSQTTTKLHPIDKHPGMQELAEDREVLHKKTVKIPKQGNFIIEISRLPSCLLVAAFHIGSTEHYVIELESP